MRHVEGDCIGTRNVKPTISSSFVKRSCVYARENDDLFLSFSRRPSPLFAAGDSSKGLSIACVIEHMLTPGGACHLCRMHAYIHKSKPQVRTHMYAPVLRVS